LTESSKERIVTAPAPTHIEHTVQAIVRLRAEHVRRASPLQRTIERFTARAGSPGFAVFLTVLVASWIGLNCLLPVFGRRPIDEPPFYWMQGAVALCALYMTVFILVTQRREDELANRHEQLTLELAMLSEQKAAKIISLLERLRQDHPEIRDRVDMEADAMSSPADSRSILEALKHHTKTSTTDSAGRRTKSSLDRSCLTPNAGGTSHRKVVDSISACSAIGTAWPALRSQKGMKRRRFTWASVEACCFGCSVFPFRLSFFSRFFGITSRLPSF
jgi:uncharacterized membrane protein